MIKVVFLVLFPDVVNIIFDPPLQSVFELITLAVDLEPTHFCQEASLKFQENELLFKHLPLMTVAQIEVSGPLLNGLKLLVIISEKTAL